MCSDADQSHEDICEGFQLCTCHPLLMTSRTRTRHIKPLCGTAAAEIKNVELQPAQQAAPQHPALRSDANDETAVPVLPDMPQDANTSSDEEFLGF